MIREEVTATLLRHKRRRTGTKSIKTILRTEKNLKFPTGRDLVYESRMDGVDDLLLLANQREVS
jgi:hypothetical protein